MRLLFLQNVQSRYNVLNVMTKELSDAFERQGVKIKIFDAWDEGPDRLRHDIDTWKPDRTLGINIFAHNEVPNYIAFSVDALNHCSELLGKNPSSHKPVVVFADGWSCDFYAAQKGTTFWFPHAISKELLEDAKKKPLLPRRSRPYEAILLGSFIDSEEIIGTWNQIFSHQDAETLCLLVEHILNNPYRSIQHEVLALTFTTPSIKKALEKNSISLSQFTSTVEQYLRGLDRTRLLYSFPEKQIHIFGEGWKNIPANAVLHPPLSFSSLFEICKQAKIVLNSMPMIRKGYHERLFMGLAAGAIVVTSQTTVPDLLGVPTLVQYTTSSLTKLKDHVAAIGEIPPPFGWLERSHTWDARVQAFLPWLCAHSSV